MIRKKIDDKIQILLKNSISKNERSMFLIIGDKGRDQISNLHNFYSQINPGKKLNILWCYKNELGFSNHARKKMKKIKKQMNKGVFELNDENAFDLFISTADIKFCYYHETQRILGTTFGMLILQDFEAITPNLLCRTIETVQGGGVIIFLLSNMTSLKQLYTLSMDVHDRYRTEKNKDIEPRFNERFILSLTSCKNVLAVDDELNLLPITNNMKNMVIEEKAIDESEENIFISKREKELNDLKKSLQNKNPIGPLLNLCKTVDQAKAIMCLVDIISEKNPKNTVSLTSGRGRGKSSSMGLGVAGAVVYGYSNIIITAPSPENLKTFFEFLIKGLNALNYTEHKDYIIQEGTGDFKGSIISIDIIKDHKQTIKYILPTDILLFQLAELLIIDEAAAIPLNIVKRILPDCVTFMASTIQGYEGTGRSLSIKLIDEMRNNQKMSGSRILKEISLSQAIRYADNDPIELWLNKLLILDATSAESFEDSLEDPSKLELYMVNRDTLFSYHKGSEAFLKKIMSLFVSSHYKNSPNDLQLLSDAPSHKIFVLCKALDKQKKAKGLPDIYCAIQVCEEGGISKDVILTNNKRGLKPSGDLIPWTISEHYQDQEFAHMTSIRIVRIACHPDCQRMGYGSKALELLSHYYEGKFIKLDYDEEIEESGDEKEKTGKKKLKPLLSKLEDIKPPFIYYLGTSFGLTNTLYNFWQKNGYKPLYIAMNSNSITGEHSCIMIKPLNEGNIKLLTEDINTNTNNNNQKIKWFIPFSVDFKHRLTSLLSFNFNKLNIKLCLSILEPHITTSTANDDDNGNEDDIAGNKKDMKKSEIELFLTKFDFKRMELYSRNMTNYNMIIDLIPTIANLYFNKKIYVPLSYIQAGVLLGVGLQRKSFDEIVQEFNIEINQLLAMFNKMVKKFVNYIKNVYQKDIEMEEEKDYAENKEILKTKNEFGKNILKEMQKELKGEGDKIIEKDRETKKKYMEEKLKKMEQKQELTKKKRKREKTKEKENNDDKKEKEKDSESGMSD
jgi:N-acetyltransferase 10